MQTDRLIQMDGDEERRLEKDLEHDCAFCGYIILHRKKNTKAPEG